MKLYVIYDVTAEDTSNVFEGKSDAVAQRQLERLRKDSDWADEFELWCVGERFADQHPLTCMKCREEPYEVRAKLSDVEDEFAKEASGE